MRRHWQYLKYVMRHKWFVFRACLQLGVPLWIAIFHDWDKFLPDEWFPYARTFYAPDGTKQYQESIYFSVAWMHHQHRNKHHWQYWCKVDGIPIRNAGVMIWDRGTAQRLGEQDTARGVQWVVFEEIERERITVDPMPDVYRREMLADWRGAGLALGMPDTLAWYLKNKENIKLHPDTRAWLEEQLTRAVWEAA